MYADHVFNLEEARSSWEIFLGSYRAPQVRVDADFAEENPIAALEWRQQQLEEDFLWEARCWARYWMSRNIATDVRVRVEDIARYSGCCGVWHWMD